MLRQVVLLQPTEDHIRADIHCTRPHAEAEEQCEEEGQSERSCVYGLTTNPIPPSPCTAWGRGRQKSQEAELGGMGFGVKVRLFWILSGFGVFVLLVLWGFFVCFLVLFLFLTIFVYFLLAISGLAVVDVL